MKKTRQSQFLTGCGVISGDAPKSSADLLTTSSCAGINRPTVRRPPAAGTGFLEEALRVQAGLEQVPPAAELSSTTAIKAAVAAGAGPAVLSSLAVVAELAAGTLCAVPVTGVDLGRTLMAVWAEGRRLAGPARDLYTIAARGRQSAPRLSGPTKSRARRPPEP